MTQGGVSVTLTQSGYSRLLVRLTLHNGRFRIQVDSLTAAEWREQEKSWLPSLLRRTGLLRINLKTAVVEHSKFRRRPTSTAPVYPTACAYT